VGGLAGQIMSLNPMTPILEGYRDVVLRGRIPDPAAFITTTVVSIALLTVAWIIFHRAEYQFAENV
jgi:ABC-type polysaccharide/polyol phosphate export permease